MKSTQILFLFTFLFFLPTTSLKNIKELEKKIDIYLTDKNPNASKLRDVLESGSMDGHFKSDEIYAIFAYLTKKHSSFVSQKEIGKTVQQNNILAFYLTRNKEDDKKIEKSKILFTGAHHARELVTATIVLKIFIEGLHSLIHDTAKSLFWKINDLVIVPIVNLDGHKFISDAFGTDSWEISKYKRKNMNLDYCG